MKSCVPLLVYDSGDYAKKKVFAYCQLPCIVLIGGATHVLNQVKGSRIAFKVSASRYDYELHRNYNIRREFDVAPLPRCRYTPFDLTSGVLQFALICYAEQAVILPMKSIFNATTRLSVLKTFSITSFYKSNRLLFLPSTQIDRF